jgi:hypothetical protein
VLPVNATIADFWVEFQRSEGLQDSPLVPKYKFLEDPESSRTALPFLAQHKVFKKPLKKL